MAGTGSALSSALAGLLAHLIELLHHSATGEQVSGVVEPGGLIGIKA